jgi:hypothetical protein
MKTNYFWGKLETIFGEKVGGYYDVRHGKVIKYRVKLTFAEATKKQLTEIAKIDGVVKVKNKTNYGMNVRASGIHCVNIYLSKRISEVRTAKEVRLDKEDLRTTLAAKRYFARLQAHFAAEAKK